MREAHLGGGEVAHPDGGREAHRDGVSQHGHELGDGGLFEVGPVHLVEVHLGETQPTEAPTQGRDGHCRAATAP